MQWEKETEKRSDKTAYTLVNPGIALPPVEEKGGGKQCDDAYQKSGKIVLQVNDLEKRVCYFSLAGDHALKAFEKFHIEGHDSEGSYKKLKAQVTQRLYFAVIMFDIVILHCSDPLRSPLIKEILNDHIDWIETGRIRFIASNDINDWQQDYEKYINRKYTEYQTGYFASLEAESLRQDHITEAYKQSVKDLLGKSKYYIRKDSTISSQFEELLKLDIKHNNEQIVISLDSEEDNMFAQAKKFAVEKTVYQLLHAQYYSLSTNNNIQNVFDSNSVDTVFSRIRRALGKGQAVARPALVEAIRELIADPNELQDVLLDAITLRMDLLYCRMNAGKHLILEFHPSYESQTLYRLECFDFYLKKFEHRCSLDTLTVESVNKMINSNEIDNFRRIFLASMADMHEQNNFTIKMWTTKTVFEDRCKRLLPSNVSGAFAEICAALKA